MVGRIPRPSIRQLHASCRHAHLVGPPDSVSNIRPVIYDDHVPLPRKDVTHPYSLREFKGDTREYQWKMQRQQMDAYNHAVWADSNTRFEAAKSAVLASLPASCSPRDQEDALSVFYRSWVVQETAYQQQYSLEWRKQNWESIVLGARLSYEKFMARISRPFSPSNQSKDD